jgi:hypothetical protein
MDGSIWPFTQQPLEITKLGTAGTANRNKNCYMPPQIFAATLLFSFWASPAAQLPATGSWWTKQSAMS